MSIDDLIGEGTIRPFRATHGEIERAIEIARRDLSLAENLLGENLDWSFSIAYNAVLQTCRAYMFHLGYRPSGAAAHKATFEFIQIVVAEPFRKSVSYFDQVRKKRHRTVYEGIGLISEQEAKGLLRKAREFLSYVETEIKEQ